MKPELSGTLRKIALVSAGSFVFAFSLVPLYNAACEKVFGIKLEKGAAGREQLAGMHADLARTVRVQFDGTVNSQLPWEFKPLQLEMDVVPGKQYEAQYVARNFATMATVGHASPSIAPVQANGYFVKTECFCFTEQRLAAGEQRMISAKPSCCGAASASTTRAACSTARRAWRSSWRIAPSPCSCSATC